MSGTIGQSRDMRSGVVGTWPTGFVRQVTVKTLGALASGDTNTYLAGSPQFDNPILSTSDVFLIATGTVISRTANTSNNISLSFSSADGGSLGAGASGTMFNFNLFSNVNHLHARFAFAGAILVTNPNTTTPTYRVYATRVSGYNSEVEVSSMTLMEIIAL